MGTPLLKEAFAPSVVNFVRASSLKVFMPFCTKLLAAACALREVPLVGTANIAANKPIGSVARSIA